MDGGSTDETLAVLKSYGDRIAYESGPDGGQAAALNRGFETASGEIVAWLNSDDRYCAGAIRNAVAALEAEPEAGFVYGEGELISEDGRVLSRFPATRPFDLWFLTHVSDFIMQPTVFMRVGPLREVGGLDAALRYGMDWDLWIRMAVRRPVAYCPLILAQTREHGQSKTSSGGFARWLELRSIPARHGAGRWSPAAVCYGLDTLRRKWPTVFGPSSAADLEAARDNANARVFRPIHRLTTRLIERRLRGSQGISIDRWTSDRSFLAIPWSGKVARLSVFGEVPAPPEYFPVTIEVKAAGQTASVEVTRWGEFRVDLDMKEDGRGPRPLEVGMRASKVFRAKDDPRRLAFRVREVRLTESDDVRIVRPFGESGGSGGT